MVHSLKSLLTIAALTLSGCTMEVMDGDENAAEAEQELIGSNALTSNALTSNALTSNALTSNALTSGSLAPSVLSALQDPGTTGALSRAFLHYAVGCALSTSQTVSFSWTDGEGGVHDETYRGELGIATAWAASSLDDKDQRMVSACIAARVNYYGTPVMLSIRSGQDPLKIMVGSSELASYPYVEGAFWGNLWGSSPFLNACYNSATVGNSRAWKRDCAAGHVNGDGSTAECGMIHIIGACSSVCDGMDAAQYYPSCIEKPGQSGSTTSFVVTTALP